MTTLSSRRIPLAVIFVTGALFLMAGCSDQDPAAPATTPTDGVRTEATDLDLALWEVVREVPELWWEVEDGEEFNLGASNLPFPDSPDQLMANLKAIYESRDVGEYLNTMHPDFETYLQQETIDEFPDVGPTLTRYEEQNVHKRMFVGEMLTDPDGNLLPGVQNISFDVIQPAGTWETSPEDDVIPNALWAPWEMSVMFDRGQSYASLNVEGMVRFYLTSYTFEYDGGEREFYQMIGQVDLTGQVKSTEGTNWGTVKALYR